MSFEKYYLETQIFVHVQKVDRGRVIKRSRKIDT